jgi:hypothetical protein
MAAALVQICVDPRLNHELLRAQVRQKLGRMGLVAERVYLVNEVGGNLGQGFLNTVRLLAGHNQRILVCAVLHHDDCLAAATRAPLDTTVQQMKALLTQERVSCPVLTGEILTAQNHLRWHDEPAARYQSFTFGMWG